MIEEQIPFNFNKSKKISTSEDDNPTPAEEIKPIEQAVPEKLKNDINEVIKGIDEELFDDIAKIDPDLVLTIQEMISSKNTFKNGDLPEAFVALVKIKYNNKKDIDFVNNNWDEFILILKIAIELQKQGRRLDPNVVEPAIERIKEWKRNNNHYTNK